MVGKELRGHRQAVHRGHAEEPSAVGEARGRARRGGPGVDRGQGGQVGVNRGFDGICHVRGGTGIPAHREIARDADRGRGDPVGGIYRGWRGHSGEGGIGRQKDEQKNRGEGETKGETPAHGFLRYLQVTSLRTSDVSNPSKHRHRTYN